MNKSVLVVGGGLAGLSAAVALAPRGYQVTLLESRHRLGGRASSFHDVTENAWIDTCQHVSMGCCTSFAQFCETLGIKAYLQPQPRLYFMTADRAVSTFGADALPVPLHLLRSFWRAHYLTLSDKLRIAWGLTCLRFHSAKVDVPLLPWLLRHKQTPRTLSRFWSVVLTSALNESLDKLGIRYARKVLVEALLQQRKGFEVEIPTVPLSRLYGPELLGWLAQHQVEVVLGARVQRVCVEQGRVLGVEMSTGEVRPAECVVLATPFARTLELLPTELCEEHEAFRKLRQLQVSPITSLHVWYDRPICAWPHVVLVDCQGQWLFNRGESAPGRHYVQVVVSASRDLVKQGHEKVQQILLDELKQLFPAARAAQLLHARTVTEHAATFSAHAGVDELRPTQETPLENLYLAGDYTATGWPATMEGAVRSGNLAADRLHERWRASHA